MTVYKTHSSFWTHQYRHTSVVRWGSLRRAPIPPTLLERRIGFQPRLGPCLADAAIREVRGLAFGAVVDAAIATRPVLWAGLAADEALAPALLGGFLSQFVLLRMESN